MHQKNVKFVTIGFLKILDLNFNGISKNEGLKKLINSATYDRGVL